MIAVARYEFAGEMLTVKEIAERVPAYKVEWIRLALKDGCCTIADFHARYAGNVGKRPGGSQFRQLNKIGAAEKQRDHFAHLFIKGTPAPSTGRFSSAQALHHYLLGLGFTFCYNTVLSRIAKYPAITWAELTQPARSAQAASDSSDAVFGRKRRADARSAVQIAAEALDKRKKEMGID